MRTGEDVDLRLLPAALAAWAAAWLAPGEPVRLTLLASGVTGLVALIMGASRRAASWVLAAALAVGAAAGAGAAARVHAVNAGPVHALAMERATATVDLRITGDPVVRRVASRFPDRGPGVRSVVLVPAAVRQVTARGVTTSVHSSVLVLATHAAWAQLIPGQILRTSGRFAAARPGGSTAALLQVRGPPVHASAAPWRDRAAAGVRAGLRTAVAGLPPDERGLVPGLVLGDTSGIDDGLTADFRVAGLTHVLAVSGSNLALLLGAVLGLARLAGARLRLLPAVALVTVAAFVLVARPEPSLLRAAVMGMVGVAGLAAGRTGRAMPALCGAVVLLVLVDPWLARSYGFALSVCATAGLILLAPAWRDRLATRLPRPAATALAVPAAAQAACGPVLVLLTAHVGLVAIPANLLAVPAVAPAMFLGVLAALAEPVCPPVAGLFGDLAGIPAWWIVTVARRAAEVPGATVPWVGGVRGAVVLALLTLAVTLVLAGGRRVGPRPAPDQVARRGRCLIIRQIPAAALVAVALALVLLLRPPVSLPRLLPNSWPPAGWVFVVCDVGQGDALVLRAGRGAAVVVDTGPEPRPVDRCLHRLGVHEIPYLLLTHFHADHVEGLPGVLRGRRVAEIGVSPLADPPVEVERVRGWVGGIPLTHPSPGERRVAGAVSWRVLWPSELIPEGSAPNNASVVLLAEVAGIRLLLTGDIEPPAQAALHRAEPGLRVDVLKIPHHGSANQDAEFLTSLGARIAIASAGLHNDYGHPAPSTLRLLAASGMRVAHTDRDGDVAVVVRHGELLLATDRGG